MTNLVKVAQLELKTSPDGSLGVVEFSKLDFIPARIYWISEVAVSSERGHHAHRALTQQFYMLTGSVDIEIFDREEKTQFQLNRDSPSLVLRPGLWRVLKNFSKGACLLVLCDKPYDEADYIRDYREYLEWCSSRDD